jgi:acyl dehydratase
VAITVTLSELEQLGDIDLGTTDWVQITQEMIDRFADATGDDQWIHVDPERAATGPFGQTIAHGLLTLSLLPALVGELLEVTDSGMGVNYGLDRVRLTSPVPAGSKVRARGRLVGTERKGEGVLMRIETTVEIDGSERPALVATALLLRYP